MEMFENFREQNSGYPLQGRVLEGLAGGDVVAETVALTEPLDAGSPAIAVRSSARVEEDEDDVVVAFCAPMMVVVDALSKEEAELTAIELLGWRDIDVGEESCAMAGCVKKT